MNKIPNPNYHSTNSMSYRFNDSITQLLEILKLELVTGEELLKTSIAQKLALNKPDLNKLKTATEQSDELLGKLMNLEDERTRILLNISSKLGIPCEKLTICELMRQIEHSSHFQELGEIRQKLGSVFQKLMTISKTNEYLISRSLGFVEDRMRVLNYALTRIDTYGPEGKKEAVKLGNAIVNREI